MKTKTDEADEGNYERVDVYYSLWGARFSPSRLRIAGKVQITDANDSGDIGKTGRFIGKPRPYGACEVRCTIKGRMKIAYLARHLAKHLAYYKARHASRVVYWILWRGVQGNMELRPNELARLAETKVSVAMNYIHMEE